MTLCLTPVAWRAIVGNMRSYRDFGFFYFTAPETGRGRRRVR